METFDAMHVISTGINARLIVIGRLLAVRGLMPGLQRTVVEAGNGWFWPLSVAGCFSVTGSALVLSWSESP